jgi:hypothetical protein
VNSNSKSTSRIRLGPGIAARKMRPLPSRFIEVATGQSVWTAEEVRYLVNNPRLMNHALQIAKAISRLRHDGLETNVFMLPSQPTSNPSQPSTNTISALLPQDLSDKIADLQSECDYFNYTIGIQEFAGRFLGCYPIQGWARRGNTRP